MSGCHRRRLMQQSDIRSRSQDPSQIARDRKLLLCQAGKVDRVRKEIGPILSAPLGDLYKIANKYEWITALSPRQSHECVSPRILLAV